MEEDFYRIPADVPDAHLSGPPDSGDSTFYSATSNVSEADSSGPLEAASTPGTVLEPPAVSPILPHGFNLRLNASSDFVPHRRINYSSEGDLTPPPEPTTTCLGAWKPTLVDVDKYVDDNLQEERVNMENAPRSISHQTEVRLKHAVATQNVFRHVIQAAENKGMKVNASKTNMICISDSLTFKASCYIQDRLSLIHISEPTRPY